MLKKNTSIKLPVKQFLLMLLLFIQLSAGAQVMVRLGFETGGSYYGRELGNDRKILYYGPTLEVSQPVTKSRFRFYAQSGFAWISPSRYPKETLIPLLAGTDFGIFDEKESGLSGAAGLNYMAGRSEVRFQYKVSYFHSLKLFGTNLQQRFGFMSIAGEHYAFIQLNLFGFPLGR